MATYHPTSVLPSRQPPTHCACGSRLHTYRSTRYCPDCTSFSPCGVRPAVEVSVGTTFEAAGELLQRLADAGWDVVAARYCDGRARLYHPRVRTAAEARALLAEQGYDLNLFSVEG